MAAVAFLWFCANLILALGLFTVIEVNFPDSWVGRTLGTLH